MNEVKLSFLETIRVSGSLFSRKEVFKYNYVPKIINFRGDQLNKMGMHSTDIESGISPDNMMLLGGVATGKTTTMLAYFEYIKEEHNNVKCVYVHCYRDNTLYKVYSRIYKELTGLNNVNGVKTSDLYDRIMNYIMENDFVLIVGLDDYEFITSSKDLNDLYYGLLRAGEMYSDVEISIITATSDKQNNILKDSVITSFQPVEVHFPNYTHSQIFEILKQRCDEGFYKGVINDKVINLATDYTYEKGDLRYGIKLLLKAGRRAEKDNSCQILERYLF